MIDETLHKAVTRRSELETKHFTLKTNETWKVYKNNKINTISFTGKLEKSSMKISICSKRFGK